MRSEKTLSKIVDSIRVPWSPKQWTFRYQAALITRNVRYRDWDMEDVRLQLELINAPLKGKKRRTRRTAAGKVAE